MRLLLVISLFISLTYNLTAQIESESRFERFINNFYSKPDYVQNQVLLSAFYARTFPDFRGKSIQTKFTNLHNLDFYYGFVRIDEKSGIKNYFKHQGEFLTIGNISTNFKTFDVKPDGVVTDAWRFGFGINDGYGLNIDKNNRLFLNHTHSISFNRADFDLYPLNPEDTDFLNRFDEEFKFGSVYSGGLRFQVYSIFNIDVNYEHAIYYPKFEFFPWFGSWLTDLVLQRAPDLFEKEFIESMGTMYPWAKFFYKNFVSFILYELRRSNSYFPVSSEKSMNYDALKFGIVLII